MNRKITPLLIAIAVNILLIATNFYLADVSGSIALRASGWHSFADVFVSIVVLIGVVLAERTPTQPSLPSTALQGSSTVSNRGGLRIEHAVSLFVSIFVFYMGYRVFADVIRGDARACVDGG